MDWHEYFFSIADTVRQKSKDPRSKIGAVIVSPNNSILSTGYNGFPRGVADTPERWSGTRKYDYVVHAEENAILAAAFHGHALKDSTMYLVAFDPPWPCKDCAQAIIQAGITKFYGSPRLGRAPDHWQDSLRVAEEMMGEAGVQVSKW